MYGQDNISMPSNHSAAGQYFSDWRLPTKYELNIMYTLKSLIGGFADDYYWSSTMSGDYAWSQYFLNGAQYMDPTNLQGVIRSVRTF
jgi:hypothetical protein